MRNGKLRLLLSVMLVLPVFFCGCDSSVQKKQAAELRWRHSAAQAKVPLAQSLFEKGRLEDARQTLQECIDNAPDYAQAHLLMGKINLAQSKTAQAKNSFYTAVELDGTLDEGYYFLGSIAMSEELTQQALDYYNSALEIQPANSDYIIAAAQSYVLLGRPAKALSLLQERIDSVPANPAFRAEAADVLKRLGNTKDAIDMYNHALALEPANTELIESLAYCYVTDAQWDKAAAMFEKLLGASEPADASTYLKMLALCSMEGGRYGTALACYDKLSVQQRDNPQLWLRMGHASLGADAPDKALFCAQRALELKPAWPDALAVKGCAEYLGRNYSEAINTFGMIKTDRQFSSLAWFITGKCYDKLGETELAQKAYEYASEVKSESELYDLINEPKS